MASRVKRFAEHQLDLMDVVLEGCPQDTPRIPPGYPDDTHDPEGRGTDLVLSHLRDGRVPGTYIRFTLRLVQVQKQRADQRQNGIPDFVAGSHLTAPTRQGAVRGLFLTEVEQCNLTNYCHFNAGS